MSILIGVGTFSPYLSVPTLLLKAPLHIEFIMEILSYHSCHILAIQNDLPSHFTGAPGVLLIGGQKNNHMTTVLPMTDEAVCRRVLPDSSMFRGVYGLAAAIYNHKEVMVCGGYRKSCHSLDLHNNSAEWEVAPDMPKELAYHTMTTLGNSGAVAVTGGRSEMQGEDAGRSLNKHIFEISMPTCS